MELTIVLSMFTTVRVGNVCNMYTTIVIVKCNDEYVNDILHTYLVKECFAEIDQEIEDITQYTSITKYDPDLTEFENLVHQYQDYEPTVQYVTADLEGAYISATRRYCGCWYND